MTLLHAKANGLQAIDITKINFKDNEAFMEEAKQGYEMGFTGKQVIHPSQIELAHQVLYVCVFLFLFVLYHFY